MLLTTCTLLFELGLVVRTARASYTGVVEKPGLSSATRGCTVTVQLIVYSLWDSNPHVLSDTGF